MADPAEVIAVRNELRLALLRKALNSEDTASLTKTLETCTTSIGLLIPYSATLALSRNGATVVKTMISHCHPDQLRLIGASLVLSWPLLEGTMQCAHGREVILQLLASRPISAVFTRRAALASEILEKTPTPFWYNNPDSLPVLDASFPLGSQALQIRLLRSPNFLSEVFELPTNPEDVPLMIKHLGTNKPPHILEVVSAWIGERIDLDPSFPAQMDALMLTAALEFAEFVLRWLLFFDGFVFGPAGLREFMHRKVTQKDVTVERRAMATRVVLETLLKRNAMLWEIFDDVETVDFVVATIDRETRVKLAAAVAKGVAWRKCTTEEAERLCARLVSQPTDCIQEVGDAVVIKQEEEEEQRADDDETSPPTEIPPSKRARMEEERGQGDSTPQSDIGPPVKKNFLEVAIEVSSQDVPAEKSSLEAFSFLPRPATPQVKEVEGGNWKRKQSRTPHQKYRWIQPANSKFAPPLAVEVTSSVESRDVEEEQLTATSTSSEGVDVTPRADSREVEVNGVEEEDDEIQILGARKIIDSDDEDDVEAAPPLSSSSPHHENQNPDEEQTRRQREFMEKLETGIASECANFSYFTTALRNKCVPRPVEAVNLICESAATLCERSEEGLDLLAMVADKWQHTRLEMSLGVASLTQKLCLTASGNRLIVELMKPDAQNTNFFRRCALAKEILDKTEIDRWGRSTDALPVLIACFPLANELQQVDIIQSSNCLSHIFKWPTENKLVPSMIKLFRYDKAHIAYAINAWIGHRLERDKSFLAEMTTLIVAARPEFAEFVLRWISACNVAFWLVDLMLWTVKQKDVSVERRAMITRIVMGVMLERNLKLVDIFNDSESVDFIIRTVDLETREKLAARVMRRKFPKKWSAEDRKQLRARLTSSASSVSSVPIESSQEEQEQGAAVVIDEEEEQQRADDNDEEQSADDDDGVTPVKRKRMEEEGGGGGSTPQFEFAPPLKESGLEATSQAESVVKESEVRKEMDEESSEAVVVSEESTPPFEFAPPLKESSLEATTDIEVTSPVASGEVEEEKEVEGVKEEKSTSAVEEREATIEVAPSVESREVEVKKEVEEEEEEKEHSTVTCISSEKDVEVRIEEDEETPSEVSVDSTQFDFAPPLKEKGLDVTSSVESGEIEVKIEEEEDSEESSPQFEFAPPLKENGLDEEERRQREFMEELETAISSECTSFKSFSSALLSWRVPRPGEAVDLICESAATLCERSEEGLSMVVRVAEMWPYARAKLSHEMASILQQLCLAGSGRRLLKFLLVQENKEAFANRFFEGGGAPFFALLDEDRNLAYCVFDLAERSLKESFVKARKDDLARTKHGVEFFRVLKANGLPSDLAIDLESVSQGEPSDTVTHTVPSGSGPVSTDASRTYARSCTLGNAKDDSIEVES